MHLVPAGVKGFGEALDVASLSRGVIALIGHRDGNSLFDDLALQLEQPELVLLQQFLVLFLRFQLLVEIELVEVPHGSLEVRVAGG